MVSGDTPWSGVSQYVRGYPCVSYVSVSLPPGVDQVPLRFDTYRSPVDMYEQAEDRRTWSSAQARRARRFTFLAK